LRKRPKRTSRTTDIVVSGSGVQLFVHPLILGDGKRLFEEGEERTALVLADSRAFATGVVHLTYTPAAS